MLSPVGPIGLEREKIKSFCILVLRRMALSAAATVGTEFGKLIVKRIVGGDDDENDDEPEEPET